MSKVMISAERLDVEHLGKPVKLQVFRRKVADSGDLDYDTREISVGYLEGFFKSKGDWMIYLKGMGGILVSDRKQYFEVYVEDN